MLENIKHIGGLYVHSTISYGKGEPGKKSRKGGGAVKWAQKSVYIVYGHLFCILKSRFAVCLHLKAIF